MSIAFPVEVAGIDLSGNSFSEKTKTTTVSRYGCCLPLFHSLHSDQEIHIRRIGTDETADGRVVASMGSQANRRLYGVGTHEPCEGLWGIRFSSAFSGTILENTHDGIYFVDRDRRITYWNDGAQQLSGYSPGEAIGKSCFENFLGHVDEVGRPLCSKGCPLSEVMMDGRPREKEMYLRHQGGHRIPINVRAFPVRNQAGTIVGAVEVFSDSTVNRKIEEGASGLERLALRDTLTGLPNRRYLELKVEQALEEHRRFGRLCGLLKFDIDRFKQVNDTHSHDVGDALLKAVAETLVRGLRKGEITGRWGAEEFLVLTPDLDAIGSSDLAERCRVLIGQSSVSVGSSRVAVTASIGATVLSHSDTMESAIRRVDELKCQSRHAGGDRTTAG